MTGALVKPLTMGSVNGQVTANENRHFASRHALAFNVWNEQPQNRACPAGSHMEPPKTQHRSANPGSFQHRIQLNEVRGSGARFLFKSLARGRNKKAPADECLPATNISPTQQL